jgi:hypothetical protein
MDIFDEPDFGLVIKFFTTSDQDRARLSYNTNLITIFSTLQLYTFNLNHDSKTNNEYISWEELVGTDLVIKDPRLKDDHIHDMISEYRFNIDFINQVLLYRSGRPKQDMYHITKMIHNYIDPDNELQVPVPNYSLPYHIVDIDSGVHTNELYFPVARYVNGMSGIYFYKTNIDIDNQVSEPKDTFCGTFYYYEPDSKYLLRSNKTLVANNKVDACLRLGLNIYAIIDIYTEYAKLMYDTSVDNSNIDEKSKIGLKSISRDAKLRDLLVREYSYNIPLGMKAEDYLEIILNNLIEKNNHLHFDPQYYAFEDILDQGICINAKDNGYDIIVLKFMTGQNRIVSEIYDTRYRQISYSNIYFPPRIIY